MFVHQKKSFSVQISCGYKVSIHSHPLSEVELSWRGRWQFTVLPPHYPCPARTGTLTKVHSCVIQLSFPLLGCSPGSALQHGASCQLLPHGCASTNHLLPPLSARFAAGVTHGSITEAITIYTSCRPAPRYYLCQEKKKKKSVFATHSLTCGKIQMKTRQFIILTCLQPRVNSRLSSAVYFNLP